MCLGILRRDAFGPGVGVDDRGCAHDKQTADAADQVLRPHRPLREAEPRPPLPARIEAEHDARAGERAERPARCGADRALRSAAYEGESIVERRDGLARRHPPPCAAPEQLGAEGDNESGNAEIGDERTMKRADRRAERQSENDCKNPDRRIVEAEIDRHDADLRDADDRRHESDDRSDRQIDVPHDDDEHHARRHNGDRGGLNRQVPEVPRSQEQALAGLNLRVDIEPDPDQRQRADHAEHAGIDLGGSKQSANGGFVGGCAGRARRCGGHWLSLVFVFVRRRGKPGRCRSLML